MKSLLARYLQINDSSVENWIEKLAPVVGKKRFTSEIHTHECVYMYRYLLIIVYTCTEFAIDWQSFADAYCLLANAYGLINTGRISLSDYPL